MIETNLDAAFLSALSLREKQIQQNYRPFIAVHKWFARRPGSLFRGLMLAEFSEEPLRDSYYRAHSLSHTSILDPFMGGGTPVVEANRLGCDVLGIDLNPMAYWIVKQEIQEIPLPAYSETAQSLIASLAGLVGDLYATSCTICHAPAVPVKYFLWVKQQPCRLCSAPIDLLPGNLLAKAGRHPKSVLVCTECGELNEVSEHRHPGGCHHCHTSLRSSHFARHNTVQCPQCGALNRYPLEGNAPPQHRLFAIEYHCPHCAPTHKGRFFKKPGARDYANYSSAEDRLRDVNPLFVPDDTIPAGDETDRLLRWGYRHYREMFNARQLLALELSARLVVGVQNATLRGALATNLSDLLRYQNMLCRYDTTALKSLDIFSVHGFPVGLVQCESNILGIAASEKKAGLIGSGGWLNIVTKFAKAKAYCLEPFETRITPRGEERVPIRGESIGMLPANGSSSPRAVTLAAADAATYPYDAVMFDAVFTDPPYFGNVQYAELMDFCYVWLRRILADSDQAFASSTTRSAAELTGNLTMGRGVEQYSAGLSTVFARAAKALKPGGPFVFTFHHNNIEAYCAVAVAILDARLVCSMSTPLPAEMGASIHIRGTGSSIVDTVFVCRASGKTLRRWLVESPAALANLVRADLASLESAGLKPTLGDLKCIASGHLTRLAIWGLRSDWEPTASTQQKLSTVREWIQHFGGTEAILAELSLPMPPTRGQKRHRVSEPEQPEYAPSDLVAF